MRRLKPFLSLLRKEWRDVRALTVVCALLVPIALLAMNEGFLDWRGDVGAWFVVATTALYVIVITADLVAADVSSGRARSYAALPVRAATLWSSKLAFLSLAATLFFGWALGVTTGLYATLAPPDAATMLWTELNGSSWPMPWLGLGIGAAAVVVFWSTVLERGMAVVGAALVTCAALGGIVPFLAWFDRELLPTDEALKAGAIGLPVVFLGGSIVAFVRGPHHASTVLRRLLVAAVVPLCVLVPAGAVSAAVLLERLDVELGDPDVRVTAGHVSPNLRYLALLGAKSHANARVRTWILDLEDGDVVALPQRGLEADSPEAWNADGSYVAWSTSRYEWELRREYDPETGEIRRTRSADQVNAARPYPFVRWATVRRDGNERVITMNETGIERRLPASIRPRFSQVPGFIVHAGDKRVLLHDLRQDTTKVLHEGERCYPWFSPRGEYVQIWERERSKQTVFATRTGRRVALPEGAHVVWSRRGATDHLVRTHGRSVAPDVIDLRTLERVTYPGLRDSILNRAADFVALADGRIVVVLRSGRVLLHRRDDRRPRTIFDPRRP